MHAKLIKESKDLLTFCYKCQDKKLILEHIEKINAPQTSNAYIDHATPRFAVISLVIISNYGLHDEMTPCLDKLCEVMQENYVDSVRNIPLISGIFEYTITDSVLNCDDLINHILKNFQLIMKNPFLRRLILEYNFNWFVLRHSKITSEMIDAAHVYDYKLMSPTRANGWLGEILKKRSVENLITILDWIIQNPTKNIYLRDIHMLLFVAENIPLEHMKTIMKRVLNYVTSDKVIRESTAIILYSRHSSKIPGQEQLLVNKSIRSLLRLGINFTQPALVNQMCQDIKCSYFDPKCFDLLIKNGVNFNIVYNGLTPLMHMFSVEPIYPAIPYIKKMIAHGADVNNNKTSTMPPLLYFAKHGRRKVDEYKALRELNIDFNIEWNQRTLLTIEIYHRNSSNVKYLLNHVLAKPTALIANIPGAVGDQHAMTYSALKIVADLQEENAALKKDVNVLTSEVMDLSSQIEYAPHGDKYRQAEQEFYATCAKYFSKKLHDCLIM